MIFNQLVFNALRRDARGAECITLKKHKKYKDVVGEESNMKNLLVYGSLALALGACSHTQEKSNNESVAVASTSPSKAQAILKVGSKTNLKGLVEFSEVNGALVIKTNIEGLKPGAHGFHIHEKGDCSSGDFNSAGPHFNPGNMAHGSMESETRHAGDLGNIVADRKGMAKQEIVVKGLTLAEGSNSLLGRAIIIHSDQDDFKTQPTGNAGKRIACGVIEKLQ